MVYKPRYRSYKSTQSQPFYVLVWLDSAARNLCICLYSFAKGDSPRDRSPCSLSARYCRFFIEKKESRGRDIARPLVMRLFLFGVFIEDFNLGFLNRIFLLRMRSTWGGLRLTGRRVLHGFANLLHCCAQLRTCSLDFRQILLL